MLRPVIVLAIAVATALPVVGSAADDRDVARRFEGTWIYAGDADEQQARLDAIDATVDQMFGIARPFARRIMRSNTTNASCYHITLDGDRIAIGEDPDDLLWSPLDGTPVEIEGYKAGQQVWRKVVGDTLHSRSAQHNGGGTHVFRLSADGQRMTVEVVIDSQQLPEDLVYELTFRRE